MYLLRSGGRQYNFAAAPAPQQIFGALFGMEGP